VTPLRISRMWSWPTLASSLTGSATHGMKEVISPVWWSPNGQLSQRVVYLLLSIVPHFTSHS
jgi:hypothetical protein